MRSLENIVVSASTDSWYTQRHATHNYMQRLLIKEILGSQNKPRAHFYVHYNTQSRHVTRGGHCFRRAQLADTKDKAEDTQHKLGPAGTPLRDVHRLPLPLGRRSWGRKRLSRHNRKLHIHKLQQEQTRG